MRGRESDAARTPMRARTARSAGSSLVSCRARPIFVSKPSRQRRSVTLASIHSGNRWSSRPYCGLMAKLSHSEAHSSSGSSGVRGAVLCFERQWRTTAESVKETLAPALHGRAPAGQALLIGRRAAPGMPAVRRAEWAVVRGGHATRGASVGALGPSRASACGRWGACRVATRPWTPVVATCVGPPSAGPPRCRRRCAYVNTHCGRSSPATGSSCMATVLAGPHPTAARPRTSSRYGGAAPRASGRWAAEGPRCTMPRARRDPSGCPLCIAPAFAVAVRRCRSKCHEGIMLHVMPSSLSWRARGDATVPRAGDPGKPAW